MSRMFTVDGRPMKTWNVFVGCRFDCTYCNARKTALTRLRGSERYKGGFKPHLVEKKELKRRFRPGDFVFVAYMGDISFAPWEVVRDILRIISSQPDVRFLFCTKNPAVYMDWELRFPDNLYLGATIESNFDHGLSKAPAPARRYEAMRTLQHPRKFVSIEPLMNFHLRTLVDWMKEIRPDIIEVGPDNYHNNLPEPRPQSGTYGGWKVRWLLEMLRDFCPTVVEKPGLSRLLGIS
jgi:DNA repair photolyase